MELGYDIIKGMTSLRNRGWRRESREGSWHSMNVAIRQGKSSLKVATWNPRLVHCCFSMTKWLVSNHGHPLGLPVELSNICFSEKYLDMDASHLFEWSSLHGWICCL